MSHIEDLIESPLPGPAGVDQVGEDALARVDLLRGVRDNSPPGECRSALDLLLEARRQLQFWALKSECDLIGQEVKAKQSQTIAMLWPQCTPRPWRSRTPSSGPRSSAWVTSTAASRRRTPPPTAWWTSRWRRRGAGPPTRVSRTLATSSVLSSPPAGPPPRCGTCSGYATSLVRHVRCEFSLQRCISTTSIVRERKSRQVKTYLSLQ